MAKKKLNTHRDDTTGQFKQKPSKPELLTEETSKQRPESPLGIWTGIPGQSGGFTGNYDFAGGWGMSMLFPGGGGPMNPMNFPGYGALYSGSPTTYRWMLQHPILRLVRSIDVGIIGASNWEYEKDDPSVPDAYVQLIAKTFDRLRPHMLADYFVRGRDYGYASGEIVWTVDDNGYYRISHVKPLLNDVSRILQDEHGNFTGIRNNISVNGETFVELAAPFKSWKYTFDSEAGYHYGRSWLENIRATAWIDWLDAAQQMQKLTGKISGIVSVIMSPAGTFPGPIDPTTNKPKMISYRENAERSIQALANGAAGIWFPSLGLMPDSKGNIDAMKVLVELAGKSLTNIQVLDFAGQSAAIAPLLERMRHAEELMFAGGLRSAQTGLEPKRSTKALAEEHTDTGTLNAEVDDREFANQCQPLVDAMLVVNKGDRAKGSVRINCPSLVDRKTAVLKAVLLGLINEPNISREIARMIGEKFSDVFKALGVPAQNKFDANEMMKQLEQAAAQNEKEKRTKNPDPQGGRPPSE